jgi:hypothetical protein
LAAADGRWLFESNSVIQGTALPVTATHRYPDLRLVRYIMQQAYLLLAKVIQPAQRCRLHHAA